MFSRVFRFSSLTAVLAATASASLAADMPYLPPPPPPPEVEMRPTINDWSGPQIGAAIGIASMHSLYLPSAGDDPELSGDSITFTGLAGYNVQYNNLVFGVEGDFTWANITAKNRLDEVELKIPFIATARVKFGYAMDNTLLYVTGGMGGLQGKMRLTALGQKDEQFHYGYVIGGGIETKIGDSTNLRLGYLFGDFGEKTYKFAAGNVSEDINRLHQVRAGLVYNFNSDN